jgi:hypothetical protein
MVLDIPSPDPLHKELSLSFVKQRFRGARGQRMVLEVGLSYWFEQGIWRLSVAAIADALPRFALSPRDPDTATIEDVRKFCYRVELNLRIHYAKAEMGYRRYPADWKLRVHFEQAQFSVGDYLVYVSPLQ